MEKKPIEINQSSLLSLKAEILRKQQEVKDSKLKAKSQSTVKKKTIIKNPGVEERNARDEFNSEIDSDVLKQSRIALEAKSKLYDKLSKTVISEEDENLYLVQFNKKPHENAPESDEEIGPKPPEDDEEIGPKPPDDDEEIGPHYEETNVEPGDEWVEYTDCLGRSRMCLRKDLPFVKNKDKELSSFLPPEKQQNIVQDIADHERDEFYQRREQMRQQWEAQERELMNKDNIHYQDVLFNEARSHGVGYFNFSQSEEERSKQQQDLKKLREETKTKQQEVQALKQKRDAAIAARVRAAKNRQRARLGLPPLEDEPTPTPEPEVAKEVPEEKPEDDQVKTARSNYVRPWDVGKKNLSREPKSQEEWVKEKRKERPKEFAPPSIYGHNTGRQRSPEDDDRGKSYGFHSCQRSPKRYSEEDFEHKSSMHSTTKKTSGSNWKDYYEPINPYKRSHEEASTTDEPSNKTQNINPFTPTPIINEVDEPEPPGCSDTIDHPDKFAQSSAEEEYDNEHKNTLHFTTKKASRRNWKDYYSQKEKPFPSTPIINEPPPPGVSEDDAYDPFAADADEEERNKRRNNYAEIPPPPTMEYYGGTSSKSKSYQPKKPLSEIQASIEAGLKFLRHQSERQHSKTENVGFFD